jgi:ribosomal protein S18 acetylase RimI-like enzyme
MTANRVEIRRLVKADAASFREIRLEALRLHPEAFGSSFEEERGQSLKWFEGHLESAAIFGAFVGSELVGVAALSMMTHRKRAHIGFLWAMYVKPHVRRTALGKKLVEAIVEHGQSSAEIIQLTVATDNEAAIRLYQSCGFIEYGREYHAHKDKGRYTDDIWMMKVLTSGV